MIKLAVLIFIALMKVNNIFDEGNIYALLFNLRHVIHFLSFCMVKLLCYGSHFSNITFIDAKTKYRVIFFVGGFLLGVFSLTYRTI